MPDKLLVWTVGAEESYTWKLPVVGDDIEETNLFVSEDGTQTFTTEDGQDFRSEQ